MPVGLFAMRGKHAGDFFSKNVMPERIRDFDWLATEIGDIPHWPNEVRCICRTILMSQSPMAVLIGANGIAVYNDAMRPLFEVEADCVLGWPASEIVPQAADFHAHVLRDVLRGRPHSYSDVQRNVRRDGKLEKAWFDFDFTPISNEFGEISGVLVACVETTQRIRRLDDLRSTGDRLGRALLAGDIVGTWEVDFEHETVRSDERYARLHGVNAELARKGADKEAFIAGVHPEDRAAVQEAFDRAKSSGQYRFQHRVIGFDGTRTIITSGRVMHFPDGRPASFSGIVVDISEQMEMAAALAESERRFRTYTETLPHVVFGFDAEGHMIYLNRRWFEFTGWNEADSDMDGWAGVIHPEDRDQVVAEWREAIAEGAPFGATVRFRHHSGQYRWLHGSMMPIHDADGRIASWIGTLTDVHDAKLLEHERELVAHELDHRIKNLFALVNSLVRLTAREADGVQSFADSLSGRLSGLHTAHQFIRARARQTGKPEHASLLGLLRVLTDPYVRGSGGERISISGDDLPIDEGKTTAISLVIHELATNSAKYGALGTSDGRILIHVASEENDVVLDWQEDSNAEIDTREHQGFGSRLVSAVVKGQLGGTIDSHHAAGVLRIRMILSRLALH